MNRTLLILPGKCELLLIHVESIYLGSKALAMLLRDGLGGGSAHVYL